jgi:hypothetical protein
MSLGTEHTPPGAAAAGAFEPLRLQVALEPAQAETIIQAVAYREIDHTSMIPCSARWLHMSRKFKLTPNFCAKTGGIKTMKIGPQVAYYLKFEGLETGGMPP